MDTSSCLRSCDSLPSVSTAESLYGEAERLRALSCNYCELDVMVSVSVCRGVFGKQGYQCQGEKLLLSLFGTVSQTYGQSLTIDVLFCFVFSVSMYLRGPQAMPPAGRHCVSTHEENDKRAGETQTGQVKSSLRQYRNDGGRLL